VAFSKKCKWTLNWMLRPPLHFEDPSREHGLLVLNHKHDIQALLIPDLCKVLPPLHPALAKMNELHAAFSSPESLRNFRMHSGVLFTEWLAAHSPPDKHSRESVQSHQYEAWHACTAANKTVVVDVKNPATGDPGTFRPVYHKPDNSGLWDDAMNTFLHPLVPALCASRALLPEGVRPKWLVDIGLHGTGMHYIGLNVTPSVEWGLEQFTWEGTFDPKTGQHHGIHIHRDKNNTRGKLCAICVLGSFQGFWQFLLPYGLSIACPAMGVLWADDSNMLHAVGPGSGCRISIVVANHEWAETGVRREDGKKRV
jgi:hypothetical protein